MRVLIIRIGRLGDTILATPVIDVLQQAFGGDVVIDFVASPGASTAILELDRRIKEVFPLDRRRLPWRLHPVKRMLRRHSRSMPYDLVINLECGTECDDFFEFVQTREFCGRPLVQPQHIPGRHCVDTEKTIYADRLGPEIAAAADPLLDTGPDSERLPSIGGEDYIVLNPELTGPYSKKAPFSVLRSGIDCQPCLLTGEQKKCTFNRCMHELAPEKVYRSVEQMMLMAS